MNIGELIGGRSTRAGALTRTMERMRKIAGVQRDAKTEAIDEIQDIVGSVARSRFSARGRSKISSAVMRAILERFGNKFFEGNAERRKTRVFEPNRQPNVPEFLGDAYGHDMRHFEGSNSIRAFRPGRGQMLADLADALSKASRYL